MRSYRSRLLLRSLFLFALDTKLGQKAINILRQSSGKLWDRTKPLRIWVLAIPTINNEVNQDLGIGSFHVDRESIYSQLVSGIHVPKSAECNSNEKVVRVLSPYSTKGQHNILNLARYYMDFFSNSIPSVLLVSPQTNSLDTLNGFESSFNKLGDNYKKASRTSVYHIGNNSESSLLLDDFFLNEGHKVVVLHDLWLFDLFQHLGPIVGRNSLGFEMIQNSLGIFGTKGISEILAGNSFEENLRLDIGKIFLYPILTRADLVLVHTNHNLFADWIMKNFSEKIVQVPLPFGYPRGDIGNMSKVGAVDTVLISGKISGSTNLQFYIDLIISSLSISQIKRVIIFGEIVESLGTSSLKKIAKKKNVSTKSISLFRELSDSQWDELLNSSVIGVRLGVGLNGENSGIVRDFLGSGLKVVTDEKLESFNSYPELYIVKVGSNSHEIMNVIKKAVNDPRTNHMSQQLKDLRRRSLNDYDDALKRVLGTIHERN